MLTSEMVSPLLMWWGVPILNMCEYSGLRVSEWFVLTACLAWQNEGGQIVLKGCFGGKSSHKAYD